MNNIEKNDTPTIESELSKLLPNGEKQNEVKACLFNLIVFTFSGKRTSYYQELVHNLIDKFPCRIIFIESNPKSPEDHLEVKVTSERSNNSPIVCDQIRITCSESQLEKVPFIILPNIIGDLPIYLLWGQDPLAETVVLPHLINHANRLIFDSECYSDLSLFCKELLSKIDTFPTDLVDMNWALIRGWRKLLAQAFDTEAKINQLKNSKMIRITYNDIQTELFKRNETQSIYLIGWLAARLGWDILDINDDHENTKIICKTSSGECVITCGTEYKSSLQPGAILNMAIDFGDSCSVILERKEQQKRVLVHISSKESCEMPFSIPLSNLKKGIDFIKEVFHKKPGKQYRDMLKRLVTR